VEDTTSDDQRVGEQRLRDAVDDRRYLDDIRHLLHAARADPAAVHEAHALELVERLALERLGVDSLEEVEAEVAAELMVDTIDLRVPASDDEDELLVDVWTFDAPRWREYPEPLVLTDDEPMPLPRRVRASAAAPQTSAADLVPTARVEALLKGGWPSGRNDVMTGNGPRLPFGAQPDDNWWSMTTD
jgi:hypothetical protein